MATKIIFNKTHLNFANVLQQSVRYRGKFNTHSPKPRHDIARYLEEITRPVIVKTIPDTVQLCAEYQKKINHRLKINTSSAIDFEQFLARKEVKRDFNENDVMIIVHRAINEGDAIRLSKIEFRKKSIEMRNYNTIVMKLFIEQNPKYVNLLPIFETGLGNNFYLFTKFSQLSVLVSCLRHMPHFMLIGGLIQNQLFTKAGVLEVSRLDSIDTLRGELCGMLNQNLASSVSVLTQPLQNLAMTLDQIEKKI